MIARISFSTDPELLTTQVEELVEMYPNFTNLFQLTDAAELRQVLTDRFPTLTLEIDQEQYAVLDGETISVARIVTSINTWPMDAEHKLLVNADLLDLVSNYLVSEEYVAFIIPFVHDSGESDCMIHSVDEFGDTNAITLRNLHRGMSVLNLLYS